MTIAEFNKHNENHDMPCEWIGQGSGYKAKWNPEYPDDIIYIPENAYEYYYDEDDNEPIDREQAFSMQDFIDLCDGDIVKAKKLFDIVDWQFPTTELDEWERMDKYEV